MRLVAVFAIIAPLLAAAAGHQAVPSASACSPAAPDMRFIAPEADLIAVVDVIAVGGSQNPLPTLAPAPTMTPYATATFETPPPTLRPLEPTPVPPTSIPQPRPYPQIDLTGYGARARIVEAYAGHASGEIDLDANTRARLEREAREWEALPPGLVAPCPFGLGAAWFEPGRRYLVFAKNGGANVTWSALVGGPVGAQYIDGQYFYVVPRTTFQRFFPGEVVEDYTIDGAVLLIRDRVPLTTVLAIASELRGEAPPDPDIRPPDTGSAGLKGPR